MKQFNPDIEYLYTVIVRDKDTGKFNSDIRQVQARGLKGVALILNVKDEDIRYVTKSRL